MVKLTSVGITNFHNISHKIYRVKNLNYLAGRNGAGKSTALQAIQLGILGYIPGYNKKPSDIFKHAKDSNSILEINLSLYDECLSTDVVIIRRWIPVKGSVTTDTIVSPDGYEIDALVPNIELPIFNFNSFVGMTANQLKDWFISFAPSASIEVDWKAVLTEAIKGAATIDEKDLDELLQWIDDNLDTGVDKIRAVNTYLKSLKSLKTAEVSRIQSTIQTLIHYDDFDCEYSEDELTEQITQLHVKKGQYHNYLRMKEMNESLMKDIAAFNIKGKYVEDDPEYIEATEKIRQFNVDIKEIEDNLQNLSKRYDALKASKYATHDAIITAEATLSNIGECPYSHRPCEDLSEYAEQMRKDVEANRSVLSQIELEEIDLRKEIEDATKLRSELREKLTAVTSVQSDLRRNYSMYGVLESKILVLPNIDESVTEEMMDAEIAEKQDLLSKVIANKQYNQLSDTLTRDLFNTQQLLVAIKIWTSLTDVNGLQSKYTKDTFVTVADELNKWIQPMFGRDTDINASFNITEKANSFSFGVVRNDKYVEYDMLSSGEKCLYMLALMMYIISASPDKLKLIIVDDMFDHLDDTHMDILFRVLRDIKDIQFMFAGVKQLPALYEDIAINVEV